MDMLGMILIWYNGLIFVLLFLSSDIPIADIFTWMAHNWWFDVTLTLSVMLWIAYKKHVMKNNGEYENDTQSRP